MKADGSVHVSLEKDSADSLFEIENANKETLIINEPGESFKIKKIDPITNETLEGAGFELWENREERNPNVKKKKK